MNDKFFISDRKELIYKRLSKRERPKTREEVLE